MGLIEQLTTEAETAAAWLAWAADTALDWAWRGLVFADEHPGLTTLLVALFLYREVKLAALDLGQHIARRHAVKSGTSSDQQMQSCGKV